MKKGKVLDVVFLLDKSGSMHGSEEDTIGGYNRYLEEQKNNKCKITTVLFNDNYKLLHYRKDIDAVKRLTREDYYVGGCTALYDAIGSTIDKLDNNNIDKVLFIITTDGLENSSKEYTKDKITKLIEEHSNWEFIYLGANIDSYAEGTSLGISKSNIANYKKSTKGMSKMFKSISTLSDCMINDEELTIAWKKELS